MAWVRAYERTGYLGVGGETVASARRNPSICCVVQGYSVKTPVTEHISSPFLTHPPTHPQPHLHFDCPMPNPIISLCVGGDDTTALQKGSTGVVEA